MDTGDTQKSARRTIASAAAAAMLGIGVLGASAVPAQAAPAGGTGLCQAPTDAGSPGAEPNEGQWLEGHGTAPAAFTLPHPAGQFGAFEQNGVSSPKFEVKVPAGAGDSTLVNAPDGQYDVKIGDGTCGQTQVFPVKDGVLDLSEHPLIAQDLGHQMVQIRGLVTPEFAEGAAGGPIYLDPDGKPSSAPQLEMGTVYSNGADLEPVMTEENAHQTRVLGVPVRQIGLESLTVGAVDPRTAAEVVEQNPQVDITYRDSVTGNAVTVDAGTTWKQDGPTAAVLEGEVLPQLPSGRYTLSYRDSAGEQHRMFLLLGDDDRDPRAADQQLYSLPY